jgi:hypothetical protein
MAKTFTSKDSRDLKYVLYKVNQLDTLYSGLDAIHLNLFEANDKSLTSLFKMPIGNLTNNMVPMTKNGAMTSATIALDDGHDNVIVGGSNQDSYIQFPFILAANRAVYRLKVRVDAIGATAPLIGFRNVWPGATYSNFNVTQFYGYFNIATGVATTTTSGTTTTSTYNGWGGSAQEGDIIELELCFEYMRPRILKITKGNTEISIINQLKNVNADGDWGLTTHPSIILADGTYTILDYEIFSMDHEPEILIDGDSMAVGVRISHSDSITGKLKSKLPYRIASIGAGTKLLAGHLATLWEINRLRPKYLVLFHYLESCQGQADPEHASYNTWSANFAKYISTIKAMGIVPIIVYPETWAVLDAAGTNSAHYHTYLTTNYADEILIRVPTAQSFYDATGFHYNGTTNNYIADQIIAKLEEIEAL